MKTIRKQVSEKEYQVLRDLNVPGMKMGVDFYYEVAVEGYPQKAPLPEVTQQIDFSRPVLSIKETMDADVAETKRLTWLAPMRLGPNLNPDINGMNPEQIKAYVGAQQAFSSPHKRKYRTRKDITEKMMEWNNWEKAKARYYMIEMVKKGLLCGK